MIERGMLSRKVDASFGLDDLIVQQRLLAGVKEGERAACVRVVMPHVRGAGFEFFPNLWMDEGNVLDGLLDAPVLAEHVRDPPRVFVLRGVAGAPGERDAPVDVREQAVGEAVLLREGAVRLGRVEGDAEHDHALLGVVGVPVAEAAALARAAGRVRLGVEEQHDAPPAQVGEAHGAPVVVEELDLSADGELAVVSRKMRVDLGRLRSCLYMRSTSPAALLTNRSTSSSARIATRHSLKKCPDPVSAQPQRGVLTFAIVSASKTGTCG